MDGSNHSRACFPASREETGMKDRIFARLIVVFLAVTAGSTCFAAAAAVISTPPTNDVASMALSPDGLTLAVIGRFNGRNHLWLKAATGEARPLPDTADAVYPFWSPDGSKLGFFSEDEISPPVRAGGRTAPSSSPRMAAT
jgi:hypothetical protein